MAEMSQAAEAFTQATTADSSAPVNTNPVYEVGFHIVPTVPEDGVGAVVQKIRAALGAAEIIAEGAAARMTLAYQIERASQGKREKFTESYFGWIKFAHPADDAGERIRALEVMLRDTKEVLRYLLIKTAREDLMQQKGRAVYSSDRLEG